MMCGQITNESQLEFVNGARVSEATWGIGRSLDVAVFLNGGLIWQGPAA